MIEIILVVVIIGIAAAVTAPSFLHSMREARLRMSVRTLTTMHRDIRSQTVLAQKYMALLVDSKLGTLEAVDQSAPELNTDMFLEGQISGSQSTESITTQSVGVRQLEETVEVSGFSGGSEIDSIYFVRYYPNGMCDPFSIELRDERGRFATIRVNGVTGSIKTEYH